MKIWIGGEVDSDIFEPFRIIRNEIEIQVNNIIEKKYYGDGLNSWDLILIIKKEHGVSSYKYNKRTKETDIRLPINYQLFAKAVEKEKKEIVLNCLIECLGILRINQSIKIDFDDLVNDLKRLQHNLR